MSIPLFLTQLKKDDNGIYLSRIGDQTQHNEMLFRDQIALRYLQGNTDYLSVISKHHSLAVMDNEFTKFLSRIPLNGNVIDVGTGWGWIWRNIDKIREDVTGILVDFSYQNLLIAKQILSNLFNRQIYLVHADATYLPFDSTCFDGYWTVQTFQYIPHFKKAVTEAYRVLKPTAMFCNFSFNHKPILHMQNKYHLKTASEDQRHTIERIFKNPVDIRYSEILFHPRLTAFFYGRKDGILGKVDSKISGKKRKKRSIFSFLARQRSFCTYKS